MRLYYFTNKKYGLAAIHDSRLKIARISELNDPFEFLGLCLQRNDRRVMKGWKEDMDAQYGIICMSENWMHSLLWSHYADKHKGMALGFDVVEDGTFTKVEYDCMRPTLDELGVWSQGVMESRYVILHHLRRPYGTDTSRQRQDHSRRQSGDTAIESYDRAIERAV